MTCWKHTLLLLFLVCIIDQWSAQDSTFIRVHFLFGSRPARNFRHEEARYFGGVLGGHVGIEGDSNQVLNFVPSGKLHIIAKKKDRHSRYTIHSKEHFDEIFDTRHDSVKMLSIT